jgi:hypothetical protein
MKKIVFLLMLLAGTFWADTQQNAAVATSLPGYSRNPITTFGASGFGLQYRAAGILQKAGWSISLKMKLASDYLSLPQWDSPLECDRLRTVSTSWKEAKPLTAKGKKCVVAIQTPAIAKKGVESSFAEETPGVSGCDLYSYK